MSPTVPAVPALPAIRPGRAIAGASAVLLPFTSDGAIDWVGFEAHVQRTLDAGLTVALNMDTGFGPFLDDHDRRRVLEIGRALGRGFIGGAHVLDEGGAAFDLARYGTACAEVVEHGGTPIIFPSHGLASLDDDGLIAAHRDIGESTDEFLGFELGPMFHPAGRIFPLDVFAEILSIPQMVGLKHSSLRRDQEWARLEIRDAMRPTFRLCTGNDLAIDMVVYGSDYLLGLSTFAPEAFAARDAAWVAGDAGRFWQINDLLQYLGQLAFRDPVPAYRHSAAMFLAHRGLIDTDRTHPMSPTRPASDRELLADISDRLDRLLAG